MTDSELVSEREQLLASVHPLFVLGSMWSSLNGFFHFKTYGQFKVDTVIILYRCFILLKVFQLIKAYEEDLNLGSPILG